MPNWTAIASTDLNDAKVAALVNALQTAALAGGQTDPTPRVTQDVVDRIRAEIKGNRQVSLDIDTTKIPNSLKSLALRMIIRELQTRLQLPLTEDERQEKRDDLDYLRRISEGKINLELPDNPQTVQEMQLGAATQTVSMKPRVLGDLRRTGL